MTRPLSRRAPALVIFDFDGVVADSEMLANTLLADSITTHLGKPTTLDDSIRLFMGKRWEDCRSAIVDWVGAPLPEGFEERHRARSKAIMRRDVGPVAGLVSFLEASGHLPRCVASSSSPEWLNHCVEKFGVRHHFGDRLYSATQVANGKPAPDIFFHAARSMGAAPEDCVVLEDSPTGVLGARAAGMTVIGFLGASHIRDGHAARLAEAGAHHLAEDYRAVARLLAPGQS
ncbi:MAG: HAD-IA family hydrolase [Hyphomicrobiaceae bacterium]